MLDPEARNCSHCSSRFFPSQAELIRHMLDEHGVYAVPAGQAAPAGAGPGAGGWAPGGSGAGAGGGGGFGGGGGAFGAGGSWGYGANLAGGSGGSGGGGYGFGAGADAAGAMRLDPMRAAQVAAFAPGPMGANGGANGGGQYQPAPLALGGGSGGGGGGAMIHQHGNPALPSHAITHHGNNGGAGGNYGGGGGGGPAYGYGGSGGGQPAALLSADDFQRYAMERMHTQDERISGLQNHILAWGLLLRTGTRPTLNLPPLLRSARLYEHAS